MQIRICSLAWDSIDVIPCSLSVVFVVFGKDTAHQTLVLRTTDPFTQLLSFK